MTVLEDLWYGNINPHETILKDNKQFKSLLSLMDRNREKLTGSFTDQQKELLENCALYKKMWEAHSMAKDEDADAAVFSGKEAANA